MLCDRRQLLLNDLWHLGALHSKDCKQAEQDASDFKFKLEVGHELDPVAEDEECLLLILHDCQRGDIVVVQCHCQSLKKHRAVALGAARAFLKGKLGFSEEHSNEHGKGGVDLSRTVLEDRDDSAQDGHTIVLAMGL